MCLSCTTAYCAACGGLKIAITHDLEHINYYLVKAIFWKNKTKSGQFKSHFRVGLWIPAWIQDFSQLHIKPVRYSTSMCILCGRHYCFIVGSSVLDTQGHESTRNLSVESLVPKYLDHPNTQNVNNLSARQLSVIWLWRFDSMKSIYFNKITLAVLVKKVIGILCIK